VFRHDLLTKSSCLVLYDLLTSSYRHGRTTNPDDSSPSPMTKN
jgi:hypothetical protein